MVNKNLKFVKQKELSVSSNLARNFQLSEMYIKLLSDTQAAKMNEENEYKNDRNKM